MAAASNQEAPLISMECRLKRASQSNGALQSEWGGKRPGAGRPKGSKNKERRLSPPDEPRVKIVDFRPLPLRARDYTALALGTLVSVMKDTTVSAAARVTAATAVLDRGWGKPKEPVTVSSKDVFDAFDGLTDEELRAMIAMLKDLSASHTNATNDATVVNGVAVCGALTQGVSDGKTETAIAK